MKLRVEVTIAAERQAVWEHLADIASHTDWMADAVSIEFLSTDHRGLGARFACETRLGPLRTTDVMEITEWSPPSRMGVSHTGAVTGEGLFELHEPAPSGASTQLVWTESLRLPWWLGGPLGAIVARPLLRSVWRRSLAGLGTRVESTGHS